MAARKKLLEKILRGTSDAAIPFESLCSLLRELGFYERVKGSHHIFRRADVEPRINVQRQGSKAKPYQVRQVRAVILRYKLGETSDV